MQKQAFGFLDLKPAEFWQMQPKDIFIMYEGFELRRKYEYDLHVQTLCLLRLNAYTTYCVTPKKGKNVTIEKFYPMPFDREKTEVKPMTKEQMKELDKHYKRIFEGKK
jgi:hypothetical protein